jgi:uncharacterized protein YlbG (UPF0298 family)
MMGHSTNTDKTIKLETDFEALVEDLNDLQGEDFTNKFQKLHLLLTLEISRELKKFGEIYKQSRRMPEIKMTMKHSEVPTKIKDLEGVEYIPKEYYDDVKITLSRVVEQLLREKS